MHSRLSTGSVRIEDSIGDEDNAPKNSTAETLSPSDLAPKTENLSDSKNALAEEYAKNRDISAYEIEHKESRCCNMKYSGALKNLIPIRPKYKDSSVLPTNHAGLFSCLTLSWMSSIMYRRKKDITMEDLWRIESIDGAAVNGERLKRHWEIEQKKAKKEKRPPKFVKAVTRSILTRTLLTLTLSAVYTVILFLITSSIMRLTLEYVSSTEVDLFQAWTVIVLVVTVNIARCFLFNSMLIVAIHTAMRVVAGVQNLLFQKVLRLPAGGEELSGQVTNIINNDSERIMEALISIMMIICFPITFIAAVVYSWYIVDYWCLVGYLAMFLFLPVVKYITSVIGRYRVTVSAINDKRVSLMTEIMNNIRLIKMYSWEDSFARNIEKLRAEEVHKVRQVGLLQTLNLTISPILSSVALLVIMIAVTLNGLAITSATAFTLASVLNCFQFSLGTLPYILRNVAEAVVAFDRVQKILERPEHKSPGCSVIQNNLAINVKHGNFEWSSAGGKDETGGKKEKTGGKKEKTGGKKEKAGGKKEKTGGEEKTAGSTPEKDKDNISIDEPLVPVEEKKSQGLRGISLSIPKGKLIGVCGGVGSGKSSLLSALCGDMELLTGEIQVNGRVSLVSQQAWIYNSSLRNNILMGLPYNKQKYSLMLDACALETDIENLPDGDSSEIGEKGVNLSGGQKQRVSLGRAVYSDHDIFLLDDPLSAVDSRVAQHIFTKCIKGVLGGKTVLLVTHALHFLEKCDEVILVKGGEIRERGTHSDLISREGDYADFISFDRIGKQESNTENECAAAEGAKVVDTIDKVTDKDGDGKLISVETRESGSITASVYKTYIEASGSWVAVFLVLSSVIIFTAVRLFSIIWQQWWLDAGDGLVDERRQIFIDSNSTLKLSDEDLRGDISQNPDLYMYQGVSVALFVGILLTSIYKGYITIYALTKGSQNLHNEMFKSIMRAPASFFDVTPTGRIITRFSKDVDELDYRIPTFFDMLVGAILFMVATSLLVCFFFPYFIIALVVVGTLFVLLGNMLDKKVKEFKRLESVQKSPVLQCVASCISGIQTIRSFGQQDFFTRKFNELVDDHTMVMLVFRLSNRWFTFRMDTLALVITSSITALCVLNKGSFSTAVAGLALTSVNGMCQFLPFMMRIKAEFESRMTSVERIIEYAYQVPSEAARYVKDILPKDSDWPSKGCVTLSNVSLRYRSNLPLVLKNLNAEIEAGEKIGIVGRTGAGKSSLLSALLRLVELETGCITIDGVDISKVGLHSLRSKISVIPQDPGLFQGTIRYNLDPFGQFDEADIVEAAQKSCLWNVVQKQPKGLEELVEAGGQNFSIGERQLICLTRAVLRDSKILLLDEATASVDPETDQLIQKALQTAFSSATLLTVAHRLNTVANYDRIIVLDKGEIQEIGSPSDLLSKNNSLFGQMLKAIGVTTLQQLHNLN